MKKLLLKFLLVSLVLLVPSSLVEAARYETRVVCRCTNCGGYREESICYPEACTCPTGITQDQGYGMYSQNCTDDCGGNCGSRFFACPVPSKTGWTLFGRADRPTTGTSTSNTTCQVDPALSKQLTDSGNRKLALSQKVAELKVNFARENLRYDELQNSLGNAQEASGQAQLTAFEDNLSVLWQQLQAAEAELEAENQKYDALNRQVIEQTLNCNRQGYSTSYASGNIAAALKECEVKGVDPTIGSKKRCEVVVETNQCGVQIIYYRAVANCSVQPTTTGRTYNFTSADATNFPDGFGRSASDNLIFTPDNAGYVDATGARCGKYYAATSSWWQAAGGNLYAASEIKATIPNNGYLMRRSDCGSTPSNEVGLLMSAQTTPMPFAITNNMYTQRATNNTSAYPAFRATDLPVKQDFSYFAGLVNYNTISFCNSGTTEVDGVKVCKTHPGTGLVINASVNIASGEKRAVFVDGDLTITGAATKIKVADGGFLTYIVSGKVKIDKDVGSTLSGACTTAVCALPNTADIQGVFIASKIEIDNEDAPSNQHCGSDGKCTFNGACDKKIVLAGSYISWNETISLKRTFKGCSIAAGATAYADYNKCNPAETFIYRPDLTTNAPQWMKQPIVSRFETL